MSEDKPAVPGIPGKLTFSKVPEDGDSSVDFSSNTTITYPWKGTREPVITMYAAAPVEDPWSPSPTSPIPVPGGEVTLPSPD